MLRLKEILKERKMSEQELANKLGVTRQYVNAIVKERSSCSLDTLAKIAKALDAPVISLFDGYQESTKPQKLIGTIKIPNSDICWIHANDICDVVYMWYYVRSNC